jgi:hypothetical protein
MSDTVDQSDLTPEQWAQNTVLRGNIAAVFDLKRELAAANARIARLEDAGDAMACLIEGMGEADTWREAKEAKP